METARTWLGRETGLWALLLGPRPWADRMRLEHQLSPLDKTTGPQSNYVDGYILTACRISFASEVYPLQQGSKVERRVTRRDVSGSSRIGQLLRRTV